MKDYVILYRKFRRGRRSLKTAYALASCNMEANLIANKWIKEEAPLGTVMFVRKVG